MSKKRQIDTGFWSDPWVVDNLNPLDRYLFMYLLTNERTNIAGIYEISLRTIANETGIDKEEVARMMRTLESRVVYQEGWVILRKAIKNQNYGNTKIALGIIDILKTVPRSIFHYIYFPINWGDFVKQQLEIDESCMTLDKSSHYIIFNLIKFNTSYYVELGDANPTTVLQTNNEAVDALPLEAPAAEVTSVDPEKHDHNASADAIKWVHARYCDEFGTTPNRYKLTESRRKKIATRIRDSGKLALAAAIKNTARSSWHRGDNSSGWTATLDWIIKSEEQVEKLANMEGKPAPGTPGSPLTREQQLHAEQVKRNAEAALKRKAEQAL